MPSGKAITKDQILAEEESIKEQVYGYFQQEMEKANIAVTRAENELAKGRFESQFSSIYASDLDKQRQKRIKASREISSLYKRPYFSHIKLYVPADGDTIHCLLSDCPDLDDVRTVKNRGSEETLIVPFRQDARLRLLSALFSTYQAKNGDAFTVSNQGTGKTTYNPEIIRDVTILSKEIQDVRQFFPEVLFDEESIDFDEILAQRLDENRDSANLRNIIATLQREQYAIVQTPETESFVVQGCAGSGKSQCLIHRLFFLRSVIAEKGWDHVLLITPSQLFRKYSSDLMNRFHLSTVANTSISEFYRSLLTKVDERFKNRQYRFELSEEYLPDEYLRQVYSRDTIETIRVEIQNAIRGYVSEACSYLNIPDINGQISPKEISTLIEKLDREIASVSLREIERAKDEKYAEMRAQSEQLEKNIASLKKTQERLLQRRDDLIAKSEQLEKLRDDIDYAEEALSDWLNEIDQQRSALREHVAESIKHLDTPSVQYSTLSAVNDYLVAVSHYLESTCEWGGQYKVNAEHTAFLRSYIELCQQELHAFSKGKSINALERTYQKEIEASELRLNELAYKIAETERQIEESISRLKEYTNDEKVQNQTKARIEAMEASRYFLSRIESSVFEREIWNALVPLKEKCGIKTLDITDLGNGRRKETRILYKSDLLFYLRVYMVLNETADLPPYEFICVDEGQDLHEADYETLRELYPRAAFNVFGDVDQALHVDCGIRQWQTETGIAKVFELNKNYRNTPAVVDFIKDRFGARMEACGKIKKEQAPKPLHSAREIITTLTDVPKMVIIVKDRDAFQSFCKYLGDKSGKLSFVDTHSSEEAEETIPCYSIFAAKGLEFPEVLVWPENMTNNQKVVACSRALHHLYYCE